MYPKKRTKYCNKKTPIDEKTFFQKNMWNKLSYTTISHILTMLYLTAQFTDFVVACWSSNRKYNNVQRMRSSAPLQAPLLLLRFGYDFLPVDSWEAAWSGCCWSRFGFLKHIRHSRKERLFSNFFSPQNPSSMTTTTEFQATSNMI